MIYIYPTETAYALGCSATDQNAVDRIFAIKNRPKRQTLPLIMAHIEMVAAYAHINKEAEKLIAEYWPGPLTLVLDAKPSDLAEGVIAPDNSIAVRISNHPAATQLSQTTGKPFISTSANASGCDTCYDVAAVKKQLDISGITIMDVGPLPKNIPSTIVDVRNQIKVIRYGSTILQTVV